MLANRYTVILLLFTLLSCGGGNDNDIILLPPDPVPDPPPLSNKNLDSNDPGLSGLFSLGPEDYFVHSTKMGEAPALVHYFIDWFDEAQLIDAQTQVISPLPINFTDFQIINFAFEPGTVVAITWALPLPNFDVEGRYYENIPKVQDILDGTYDEYIREFARAIDMIELPVMLTLFGEMDNNAFYSFGPEGLNSALADPEVPPELDVPEVAELYAFYGEPEHPDGPERVRDAFIHVIDIFEEEGVNRPSWFMYGSTGFMSTTNDDSEQQLVEAVAEWNQARWYYPGDEYIDWVGKSLHHDDLESLENQFELAYREWGAITRRPFFSPEYSILLGEQSRAAQIEQEFSEYLTRFARFKAFAIVDQDPLTGSDEFGLFTLGGINGEFFDEIEAWQEHVIQNENWQTIEP